MKRSLFVLVVVLLAAGPALAQTPPLLAAAHEGAILATTPPDATPRAALAAMLQAHPCDVTPPANPAVVPPVAAGFCHNSKAPTGETIALTKFTVKIDAVQVFDGPLTPIGQPSATGYSYYETPKTIIPTKGQHTAVVTAWTSGGESAASSPFAFTIVDPVASAPVNLIIR